MTNRLRSTLKAALLCELLALVFFRFPVIAGETYINPVLEETVVIRHDSQKGDSFHEAVHTLGIGDPAVLLHKGTYYMYPTGDNRGYDVYTSHDLVHWKKGPRVFRSEEKGVWAPDVFYNSEDNTFYLYYTVNRRVGAAVSKSPEGPFTDKGTIVTGAIDAHMFLDDDGRYYLYYAKFPEFRIYVQPMKAPLQKSGDAVMIIHPDQQWEMRHVALTEAPWMVKHNGIYYLLYSGSAANTLDYAIGYGTAKSPAGPFEKYHGNPVMKKGNGVFGPGHCSLTRDSKGKLWMVYHQQRNASKGWDRIICVDPVWFDEKGVLHVQATRGVRQPAPAPFPEQTDKEIGP